MKILARLGALAGTPVLALGLAAPAHAGGYTYYDKAGDVTVETCDATTYECTDAVDSSIKEGDAIRSTVQHHAHNVELRTSYRELSGLPEGGALFATVRTNEKLTRHVIVFHDPEMGSDAFMIRPNGDMVKCGGISTTVSYSRNIIDVKIPRGCLSRPRWIQAGQGYMWGQTVEGTTEAPNGSELSYIDDAQTAGLSYDLRFGPKVFRG
ncbi:hypothetical protein [Nocardioides jiangxiensis]|uniref:Dehydratase n=1 Tax=Nocardioides jiangxiensis TaxID=3064524 RepID=A0ABT9B5A0_9ACTN|nr:hypothetical protein [Nocardioides sp. WY-20]MDO7868308.1 hypothetical protein [Nocardioides sp. WY-20]